MTVHGGAKPTMRQQMEMHRKNRALLDVPQDHGPDRLLHGEFRRRGPLADHR